MAMEMHAPAPASVASGLSRRVRALAAGAVTEVSSFNIFSEQQVLTGIDRCHGGSLGCGGNGVFGRRSAGVPVDPGSCGSTKGGKCGARIEGGGEPASFLTIFFTADDQPSAVPEALAGLPNFVIWIKSLRDRGRSRSYIPFAAEACPPLSRATPQTCS